MFVNNVVVFIHCLYVSVAKKKKRRRTMKGVDDGWSLLA